MKRVLLIAFHYPPIKGSSGLQRTLRYSAHLHQYGWQAEVLTVKPMAYESTANDELGDIPDSVPVHRALALNARKHLSLFGRYPGFLANPDAWMSWRFDGLRIGRKLLRTKKFDAIWSTYPIVTAHRIGKTLATEFNVPWVADFRDLMAVEDYPYDPRERQAMLALQKDIVHACSKCVLTTPGAVRHYQQMYTDVAQDKFAYLPNGYHEGSFASVKQHEPASEGPMVLLHAGILYPSERDPRPFFEALAALKQQGIISAQSLLVRFRATGHDDYYRPILKNLDIEDVVELAPALPYKEVLSEMMSSHGLLIFQAANCNEQIPAKLYEYFRAGRPIIALTDGQGDTAATIREEQAGVIGQIDQTDSIRETLTSFIEDARSGIAKTMNKKQIIKYSREHQTGDFAKLLEHVSTDN